MAPIKLTALQVAKVVDHTFLKNEDQGVSLIQQQASVQRTVQEAIKWGAFGVCVRENMVSVARETLEQLGHPHLPIVSVIGFPDGDAYSTQEKLELLEKAREQGAQEFDMVIKLKAFKKGDHERVYDDLVQLSKASGKQVLKIIFENAYLNESEKKALYSLAFSALQESFGGDPQKIHYRFFKTSTGFAQVAPGRPVGATLEDVKLMAQFTKNLVGLKPAGGVTNLVEAQAYFEAAGSPLKASRSQAEIDPYKFRIGASSLLPSLFMNNPTPTETKY